MRCSEPGDRSSRRCARGGGAGSRGPCLAEARRAKAGGKSELRRAVRRITSGQGNLKESGTENIPPAFALRATVGKGEKVR